jgi:hypothetical protein
MQANRSSTVLIAASVLLAGISGCCAIRTAESVLEGTWEIVVSNPLPHLTKTVMTFDCSGHMTHVSYTIDNENTITWNDPSSEVSVVGDQVHVSATQGPAGFTFDGTLNATGAPTEAPGKLDLNLNFGPVSLSLTQGDATLVKQ